MADLPKLRASVALTERILTEISTSLTCFKPSKSLAMLSALADDYAHEAMAEIDLVITGGGMKGYFMAGCYHILASKLGDGIPALFPAALISLLTPAVVRLRSVLPPPSLAPRRAEEAPRQDRPRLWGLRGRMGRADHAHGAGHARLAGDLLRLEGARRRHHPRGLRRNGGLLLKLLCTLNSTLYCPGVCL